MKKLKRKKKKRFDWNNSNWSKICFFFFSRRLSWPAKQIIFFESTIDKTSQKPKRIASSLFSYIQFSRKLYFAYVTLAKRRSWDNWIEIAYNNEFIIHSYVKFDFFTRFFSTNSLNAKVPISFGKFAYTKVTFRFAFVQLYSNWHRRTQHSQHRYATLHFLCEKNEKKSHCNFR